MGKSPGDYRRQAGLDRNAIQNGKSVIAAAEERE
jgi:hypothetical protein